MAQYLTIDYTTKGHYVLYDRNDFENSKHATISAIDTMMEYLRDARRKIDEVIPGDNNIRNLDGITVGLYDEYDNEGYPEKSGCCVDAVEAIWRFMRIADNLYDQERYSGKIEENWMNFR